MSKIAILDTDISPKHLHCWGFHTYHVCEGSDTGQASDTSHGTICARVLDYFASDYELFSIQIMQDSGSRTHKPMGDIRHLKEGLQLCFKLDVDIICMSAVSSILSDSGILYETAQELARKSILIAALDNRRYVTIPTAYPFVLGVQSDDKNRLPPGELAYQEKDLFWAGLYANCNIGLLKELGCGPSNSFAVPAAAAQINTWKNEGKQIEAELHHLETYPARRMKEEIFFKKQTGLYRELPLAVLYALEGEDAYGACQMAMDQLYSEYDVQSSALCSMDVKMDVRFWRLESVRELKQTLLFMECCYKTDLIFLIIKKEDREQVMMQINADLELLLDGKTVSILYENSCVRGDVTNMAELVYGILQ